MMKADEESSQACLEISMDDGSFALMKQSDSLACVTKDSQNLCFTEARL